MQVINIWDKFYLCRRPLALLLLSIFCFFLSGNLAKAQTASGNYNFLEFDQKPYYFGITLGYNTSNFRVFNSKEMIGHPTFRNVESVEGPGFNLGIVTNLK